MKTIWKYTLEIIDQLVIDLPEGAKFLSLQMQHGQACAWFLVEPTAVKTPALFSFIGTGHPIESDFEGEFLGTIQLHGGSLIFHFFRLP